MKNRQLGVNEEIAQLLASDPRIRALCKVSIWPYVSAAFLDWGVIAAAIAAGQLTGSIVVYFIACLAIAGRQHAFFALAHEAAHYRISRNKLWNDVFANCLFAYPVLFDTDSYRQNHLKHHSVLNTSEDPDWARKITLKQWQFPMSKGFMFRTYPKFLLWNGPKEWFLIMLQLARVLPLRNILNHKRKVALRALYYTAVAAPIWYFSAGSLFLYYWVIPVMFVFPSLQRVRSVAEHFGLERSHDLNSTRNVMAPWIERVLFGPHNIHYHLDHHLIASVPFYNLPELHAILEENATFQRLAHENTSYVLPSEKPLANDLFGVPGKSEENGRLAA